MLSSPPIDEPAEAAALRGRLFGDLDRLAFALEMEAAELLARGDEAGGARRHELRLGVRLAQRLVAGVWADEVNLRVQRWGAEYEARISPVASGERTARELGGSAEGAADGGVGVPQAKGEESAGTLARSCPQGRPGRRVALGKRSAGAKGA